MRIAYLKQRVIWKCQDLQTEKGVEEGDYASEFTYRKR
jgi:hypothetical protein